MRAWLLISLLAALLVGVVRWAARPPAPRPADAPATAFSEARARQVTAWLADTVGHRTLGSAGRDRAAAWLAERLRQLPGVQVEVQDTLVAALNRTGTAAMQHRLVNVLARLPGARPDAILVSAHYDTPPESVGAGDDAASVGAAVEALRVLAAGATLPRTVILVLNDGEEMGLLGSAAFTGHRWLGDVRAFVNLEAMGTAGRTALFQAGPGNPWLLRTFAAEAPRPTGTAIGQDVFASGLIPSDTDFRIYRDRGRLPGLDFALIGDGWAYHTSRDRVARLEAGSIQHIGDNTVALVRALAAAAPDGPPVLGPAGAPGMIYYDLLGRTMFTAERPAARVAAAIVAALALVALALVLRSGVPIGDVAVASGLALGGLAAAILPALAGAAVLSFVVRRPHGWYAAPWVAWLAFGALAMAGLVGAHAAWERRYLRRRPLRERQLRARIVLAALAGALVAWLVVLAGFTAAGLAAAYLPAWWVGALAIALAVAALRPSLGPAVAAGAAVVPAVLTLQVALTTMDVFIPIAGRSPAPIPLDVAIAALAAVAVWMLALTALPWVHADGGLGRAALLWLGAGAAGLVLSAARPPYTAERPKRLRVEHRVEGDTARVVVRSLDPLSPGAALARVPGAAPGAAGSLPRGTWVAPAVPEQVAAPVVLVLRSTVDSVVGERTVDVMVTGGPFTFLEWRVPASALAGWSLSDRLPARPALDPGLHQGFVVGVPGTGWVGQLRFRSLAPVTVSLAATTAPGESATLARLAPLLPGWTTADRRVVVRRSLTL